MPEQKGFSQILFPPYLVPQLHEEVEGVGNHYYYHHYT